MVREFTHLHVHTQFSLLDGQASVKALVDKAIADGMRGIAITDHGNMFGVKEFYNYISKKNKGVYKSLKQLKAKQAALKSEKEPVADELLQIEEQVKLEEQKLFKPIIGCEMYVAPRGLSMKEGRPDQSGYHLVVLAKNKVGYHNLIKLVSTSWTEGFYSRPRTDRIELEKYREGLIVSSACLGGEIPRKVRSGKLDEAEEAIQWFQGVFGDDFYIELQRHKATVPRANHETYLIQEKVNEQLIALARKFNVKIICTNDVHFVNEEHAEAHDRLICLSTGRDLDDPERMLYTKQEWMKTRQEMSLIFQDLPEALDNTMDIYNKIEYYSIDHSPIMPTFDIPESFGTEEEYRKKYTHQDLYDEFTLNEKGEVILTPEEGQAKVDQLDGYDRMYRLKLEADYLKELTYIGAKKIYGDPLSDELIERLEFELYIMKTMGFPGYFLIVQDFINAARYDLNVSVGPGRGSAAGSAVAYCLGITRIDPIKYDLLFERFLNPDRISLPDIDVDFDDDGRNEVLNWVTEKYGQEKVAHIITYGTMAAKMAIRDVARVQKLPLSEAERLAKLIPDRIPGKKITLANAIDYVPELKEAESSNDPLVRDTLKYAKMLEGNVRNTGVHACGTIICRDDITDWVPVSTAEDKNGDRVLVTQYEGSVIEDTGLIKMDFLGLKTLSIIKEAIANIKLSKGIDVDIDTIPIDDPLTYKLYSDGKTIGTFQFESAGMQKYLRELQPTVFEDLIAMNALYRPGPMDYIPDFIDRKHGRKPITYDLPIMEKYLKETYGITVYQEQVMLLARLLADFTRGESDTLRKAMGKKLHDTLNLMKPKFISGGKKNGHDPDILEKIWGDWEKFASYAFNKSHATCYSWIAYQTAYLKANYPGEYMAAVLSRNINNITEITKFMDECRAMGILVLGPDVNESHFKFTVNDEGNIRFGIGAIKGVAEKAVQAIIEERTANGPYEGIFDFIQRVNLSDCTKKNVENLALAGAFDNFPELKREQFFAPNEKGEIFLEVLHRYGIKYQADKLTQGNSLFGAVEDMIEIATPDIPEAEDWGDLERLNKERELVGIYLSAHPLDEFSIVLEHVCNTHMADLENLEELLGKDITLGGMVTSVRTGVTRNGNPYGIAKIEDFSGSFEIPFWGKDWIEHQAYLSEGMFLYIRATCQERAWGKRDPEIKISSIQLLPDVKDELIEKLTIYMPLEELDTALIEELSTIIKKSPGKAELFFKIRDTESNVDLTFFSSPIRLAVDKELLRFLGETPTLSFTIN